MVLNSSSTPNKVTEIAGCCCCCCCSTDVNLFFSSFPPEQRPHGRGRPARLGLLRCPSDTRTPCQQVLRIPCFLSSSVTSISVGISTPRLGILLKFHSGTKRSFMHTEHILSVTNFICSLDGGTEAASVFLLALKAHRETVKVSYAVKFQNVRAAL